MVKWIVKFRNERSHLWAKVVMAIHSGGRSFTTIPIKNSISGVWKNIVQLGKGSSLKLSDVQNRLEVKMGCGDKIFFWLDKWVGDYSLKDRFPDLFAVQTDKFCLVQQRYSLTNGEIVWSWGGESPATHTDMAETWAECVKLLEGVKIEKKSDMWLWKQEDKQEVFKVSDLRSELDGMDLIPET
ncbi:uncharacterized protein LOC110869954 [Helianthus annuus]|uniref:uncharacterized protein LOC110869954 n=1 Tax=Helianthus annuus TaxID=4232 RepID=UPI000B90839E|nr:uncharacterized protein LOC110869954 [Helianthus annuus]